MTNLNRSKIDKIKTPAFLFDLPQISRNANRINGYLSSSISQLYSVKSFLSGELIYQTKNLLAGYSVSSFYEARFCREFANPDSQIHLVSPALTESELAACEPFIDFVVFNSLSQLERLAPSVGDRQIGIRVNPGMSFLNDPRYDPCRTNSKLGVPIEVLIDWASKTANQVDAITGIHFHSNCDGETLEPLAKTLDFVFEKTANCFSNLEWINLGGGYLFESDEGLKSLLAVMKAITDKTGIKFYVEPGAAISRNCGFLVASVVDVLDYGSTKIAVLDTTVNHWPEVFEYQFEPDVIGHTESGEFTYQLAGRSCLAGDIFGEYSFNDPLDIGSKIVFENAGAYSMVKANMFNGINLPNIYVLTEDGELVLRKSFTFEDFANRCGVSSIVAN